MAGEKSKRHNRDEPTLRPFGTCAEFHRVSAMSRCDFATSVFLR